MATGLLPKGDLRKGPVLPAPPNARRRIIRGPETHREAPAQKVDTRWTHSRTMQKQGFVHEAASAMRMHLCNVDFASLIVPSAIRRSLVVANLGCANRVGLPFAKSHEHLEHGVDRLYSDTCRAGCGGTARPATIGGTGAPPITPLWCSDLRFEFSPNLLCLWVLA
jgi:hypothetical protein